MREKHTAPAASRSAKREPPLVNMSLTTEAVINNTRGTRVVHAYLIGLSAIVPYGPTVVLYKRRTIKLAKRSTTSSITTLYGQG